MAVQRKVKDITLHKKSQNYILISVYLNICVDICCLSYIVLFIEGRMRTSVSLKHEVKQGCREQLEGFRDLQQHRIYLEVHEYTIQIHLLLFSCLYASDDNKSQP